MSLGHIDRYKVGRETKLGYILLKDGNEYFLHHNECNGRLLYSGDYVDAFLYADKQGRVAATLYPPLVEGGQINFLEVKWSVTVILYGVLSILSKSSVSHDGKEMSEGAINNFKQFLISSLRTKLFNHFINNFCK